MIGKRGKSKKNQKELDLEEYPNDSKKVNPITNIAYSQRYFKILKQRKKLPAWEAKEQLLMLLRHQQIIILEGETGSGKTTQVPQFLIEAGYAKYFFVIILEMG